MSKIIHGDCIEVMQSMEDNSIDSIVSDPPYGISFMAKQWDKFTPKSFQEFSYQWGKEALRILKPGAYCLAFSGTRTYHRMVCGLEDAGFTIKDMIMWTYGSGFPKSLDISKAIDNYYGLEREKGNEKIDIDGKPRTSRVPNKEWNLFDDKKIDYNAYNSLPNSKEAQYWEGWGTALKPALEPIVVAQKPYENTYAENVLTHGVGGLNIDGCRVNFVPEKEDDPRIYDKTGKNITHGKHINATIKYAPDGNAHEMYKQNKGRFPSNLILSHHPECKLVGNKVIGDNDKRDKKIGVSKSNFFKGLGVVDGATYGKEIKEAWDCHPNCPIRLMDVQSGISMSGKGGFNPSNKRLTHQWSKDLNWNKQEYFNRDLQWYYDKGGASRFFYCAKAHKSERNAGLQEIQETTNEKMVNRKNGSAGIENPRAGAGRGKGARNNIATLKPINIMRYLVRLVTPPNGIVLDPFAGSGTTGIACIIECFNYILIEKRKRFAEVIIPKRLEYWKDPKNWEVLKDHNILLKINTLKKEKVNQSLGDWL